MCLVHESRAVCGVFSSDGDIDILLQGTVEQRQKLKRQCMRQESSSEDEFEKEMASELNAKMKKIEKRWVSGVLK